jgi:CrcB protein
MKLVMLAAAGGAIGAAARYLVGIGAARLLGFGFPWGTLIVNVAGCLAMGLLIELFAQKYSATNELRTFLATGILGGFTTFSAFSLDFAALIERKQHIAAFAYFGSSVGLSIIALFAGLAIVRMALQ